MQTELRNRGARMRRTVHGNRAASKVKALIGCAAVGTLVVLSLAVASATPAFATTDAVTNVALNVDSLATSATGVTYTTTFVSTDGLSASTAQDNFSSIVLKAPAGTSFAAGGTDNCVDYEVFDFTTGQSDTCVTSVVTGSGATLTLYPYISVNAGDEVSVDAFDATNDSTTASQKLKVSTSSDPTAVSVSFTLSSSKKVGSPNYEQSSYAASAGGVTDTVSFVATDGFGGGNSGGNFSGIVLAAPAGTVFNGTGSNACADYTVQDDTDVSHTVCENVVSSNSGATVTIYSTLRVRPGDELTVVASDVTNAPTAGSLDISTTADPVPQVVSTSAATASPLSLQVSSLTPSASSADYQVNFTTAHGLTASSSTITVAAPSGTKFASSASPCTFEVVDDNSFGQGCASATGLGTQTVTVTSPVSAAAGAEISVIAGGVTNDSSTASQSVTVSDSSGDGTIGSGSFTLSSTGKVQNQSVELSSSAPSATEVNYVTSFLATDGLMNGASNNGVASITLAAPSGTSFSSTACDYTVYDDVTGHGVNCISPTLLNSDATLTLVVPFNIPAGTMVTVVAGGVTSDAVTAAQSVSVSSSSDPTAESASYTLSSKGKLLGVSVQPSSHAAGATDVTYTINFSATDGLTSGNSTVELAAPAGTVFSGSGYECNLVLVYDLSSGAADNCNDETTSDAGATLVFTMPISVASGDTVSLVVNGVTNATPATVPTTEKLKISTSSDPNPAKGKYTLR